MRQNCLKKFCQNLGHVQQQFFHGATHDPLLLLLFWDVYTNIEYGNFWMTEMPAGI